MRSVMRDRLLLVAMVQPFYPALRSPMPTYRHISGRVSG